MPTPPFRRAAGLILSTALFLVSFAAPADAGDQRHPYFDDRSTLAWYHGLRDAQAAARRQGKLVFIEFGRKKCTNCRALAQNLLPHRNVKRRMGRAAVGLAAECDSPERAVLQLFRAHLPKARVLPLVAFVTPEGRWITGWSGASSVERVSAHLARAERVLRGRTRPQGGSRAHAPRSVAKPKPARARIAPARAAATVPTLRDRGCVPECVGGNCGVPSLAPPCLPNPLQLLAPRCKPRRCSPTPACPPSTAAVPKAPAGRPAASATCPPPCPTFRMDAPVAAPKPKARRAKRKQARTKTAKTACATTRRAPGVQIVFTEATHTPTVAELARDVAQRIDWKEAWQLFRPGPATVDGMHDANETR